MSETNKIRRYTAEEWGLLTLAERAMSKEVAKELMEEFLDACSRYYRRDENGTYLP